MKFQYQSKDGQYRYDFLLGQEEGLGRDGDIIDIWTCGTDLNPDVSKRAWYHQIENGTIVWVKESDDYCRLTPDAKEYAQRLVKMAVFL